MKTLSTILVALLVLFSISISTQSNIGGGYEMSLLEKSDPSKEKEIDYNYSEIPADEIYDVWDTHNIHAYSFNRYQLKDTLSLVMVHDSCDFVVPHEGYITSLFGNRKEGYHHGVDIKLQKGEKVKAAFEGMVRISQYSNSYGHVIVVRHNSGVETLYAHLSKRNVKPGDHVEAGSIIGLGGNTGRSSGAHLHFECRYKGEPINPAKIVDFKNGVIKEDTIFLAKNNFKSSRNEDRFRPKRLSIEMDSVAPKAPVSVEKPSNLEKKANDKAKVNTKVTRIAKEETTVKEYSNDVTVPKTKEKVSTAKTVKTEKVETKSSAVKDKPSAKTTTTTTTTSQDTSERRYHKVVKDDTLYSLARKNGVTVDQLRSWNNIGKDNRIKLGARIRVH